MKIFPKEKPVKLAKVAPRWERVTKANPCKICDKPDWCTAAPNTGLYCCMRVESPKPCRNGGWFHTIGEKVSYSKPLYIPEEDPPLEVGRIQDFLNGINRDRNLNKISADLGVAVEALKLLGCQHYSQHGVYSFPMRDGKNDVIGFRLRNEEGRKWAIRGSHQGLFIPQCPPFGTTLIVEGPTDCAAALTVGYYAIGRPSCSGGVIQLQQFIRNNRIIKAVIISDLDDPGLRGAAALAEHLPIKTAIMVVPAKDLRQAVKNGMDKDMIDAMINQLIYKTNYGNLDTTTATSV